MSRRILSCFILLALASGGVSVGYAQGVESPAAQAVLGAEEAVLLGQTLTALGTLVNTLEQDLPGTVAALGAENVTQTLAVMSESLAQINAVLTARTLAYTQEQSLAGGSAPDPVTVQPQPAAPLISAAPGMVDATPPVEDTIGPAAPGSIAATAGNAEVDESESAAVAAVDVAFDVKKLFWPAIILAVILGGVLFFRKGKDAESETAGETKSVTS